MKSIYGIIAGLLVLGICTGSEIALAKNDENPAEKIERKRPLSLYLTHGVSSFDSQELERLGVAEDALAIGAGVGFDLTNELMINTELLFVDSYKTVETDYSSSSWSPASARFHQDRVTVGVMWKRHVAKHLYLFPEAGISSNRLKITLVEKSYRLVSANNSYGWYAGAGLIIPIKRVFFDIRYKYQELKLDLKELGADKLMYQSTLLIGFGFVI
jgi:opacity protein-like surface antigen